MLISCRNNEGRLENTFRLKSGDEIRQRNSTACNNVQTTLLHQHWKEWNLTTKVQYVPCTFFLVAILLINVVSRRINETEE